MYLYKRPVHLGLTFHHRIKSSLEMFSKIISFCLVLLQCSVQIQGLECPQCLDFKFKYFGTQGISDSQVKNILKSLGNVLCETNEDKPVTCNVAKNGRTTKCSNVFETVVIKGVKGYDDNAGIKVVALTRNCTTRPNDEEDKCIDFTNSEEYSSFQIKEKLELFKSVFNTISVNGQVCYNSIYTKGYQQPLQKASADWLDSLANRVHISNVLYVISIMFSFKLFF